MPELQALLKREGIEDEIELRRVESLDAAEEEHFLGSPTVRIDGEDIDPDAATRSDFGVKCRLYRFDEGTSGVPPSALRFHEKTTAATRDNHATCTR